MFKLPNDINKKITELLEKTDQKTAVQWAIYCAEHVLFYFEEECPDDERPRLSINAAQDWVNGKSTIIDCREFGRAAHEAARTAPSKSAVAAARAAGHVSIAPHNVIHATSAASNAVKTVYLKSGDPVDIDNEQSWQLDQLEELQTKKEKSHKHWHDIIKH